MLAYLTNAFTYVLNAKNHDCACYTHSSAQQCSQSNLTVSVSHRERREFVMKRGYGQQECADLTVFIRFASIVKCVACALPGHTIRVSKSGFVARAFKFTEVHVRLRAKKSGKML